MWSALDSDALIPRYGHTSVATKDNIFAFGGFNGIMLNDVLKFTPGKVSISSEVELAV